MTEYDREMRKIDREHKKNMRAVHAAFALTIFLGIALCMLMSIWVLALLNGAYE